MGLRSGKAEGLLAGNIGDSYPLVMTKNSRGQSLVQVLVAVAVSTVLLMAMVTSQVNQARENRGLTEKLASIEAVRLATAMLNSPVACGNLFAPANLVDPSDIPFDTTGLSPATPKVIRLKAVPYANFNAGESLVPLSPTLKLASETDSPAGIQVVVTGPNTADLQLNFDQSALVRGLPNLEFKQIPLVTSGVATATQIVGCGNMAETTSARVWTTTGNFGNGSQFFNVTFRPRLEGSYVHLYLDIPSVGGGGSTSSSCGGMATMTLEVNGANVASSYSQFTNLAYHANPMQVSYWYKPATTAPFTITARMSASGCVSNVNATTARPVVLTATEIREH